MSDEKPWYQKDGVIIMAILSLAFIALPLVCLNPYYTLRRKVIVSVIVLVVSYFLWQGTAESLKALQAYYDVLK